MIKYINYLFVIDSKNVRNFIIIDLVIGTLECILLDIRNIELYHGIACCAKKEKKTKNEKK